LKTTGLIMSIPTDKELKATMLQAIKDFPPSHPDAKPLSEFKYELELEYRKARAVLARWGRPAIEPVPVSERLPGPEDCDAEGRCWLLTVEDEYPQWRLHSIQGAQPGGAMIWVPVDSDGAMVDCFYTSHWLPHWALPVPAPANTINQNNY
jgi:hypothetical protein